jgi:hypothetical protein
MQTILVADAHLTVGQFLIEELKLNTGKSLRNRVRFEDRQLPKRRTVLKTLANVDREQCIKVVPILS